MTHLSLKFLWIIMGVVVLSIFIALSLWDIPAPRHEVHKNIPLKTFNIK